jgi:hypothetical protein
LGSVQFFFSKFFFQKPRVTNQMTFGFVKAHIPQQLFKSSKLTLAFPKITAKPNTPSAERYGRRCCAVPYVPPRTTRNSSRVIVTTRNFSCYFSTARGPNLDCCSCWRTRTYTIQSWSKTGYT